LKIWIEKHYLPLLKDLGGSEKIDSLGDCDILTNLNGISTAQSAALVDLINKINAQRSEILGRKGKGLIKGPGYLGGQNRKGCEEGMKTFFETFIGENYNYVTMTEKFFKQKYGKSVLANYFVALRISSEEDFLRHLKNFLNKNPMFNANFDSEKFQLMPDESLMSLFDVVLKYGKDGKRHEQNRKDKLDIVRNQIEKAIQEAIAQQQKMMIQFQMRQDQKENARKNYEANKSNALGDITLLLNIYYPFVYLNFLKYILEKHSIPVDKTTISHLLIDFDSFFSVLYRAEKPRFGNISIDYLKERLWNEIEDSDNNMYQLPDDFFRDIHSMFFLNNSNSLYMCPLKFRKNILMRCLSYCRPIRTMESVLFRQGGNLNFLMILAKSSEVESQRDDPTFQQEIYAVYQLVVSGFQNDEFLKIKNLVDDRDVWNKITMDGQAIKYGE
jgi:hypothetical protein